MAFPQKLDHHNVCSSRQTLGCQGFAEVRSAEKLPMADDALPLYTILSGPFLGIRDRRKSL